MSDIAPQVEKSSTSTSAVQTHDTEFYGSLHMPCLCSYSWAAVFRVNWVVMRHWQSYAHCYKQLAFWVQILVNLVSKCQFISPMSDAFQLTQGTLQMQCGIECTPLMHPLSHMYEPLLYFCFWKRPLKLSICYDYQQTWYLVLIKVTTWPTEKKMQGALHLHFSRSIATQVIHQNMQKYWFWYIFGINYRTSI